MPITMDITQTKLTHILHVSSDNTESHEYKLTNSSCKQLVVDDNDVLTLYAHDEAHYDLLCRALDHFYFQYSINHHQTPKVAEHPENFSLVFSKHNIRELLSYLHQGRYGIINQQDFQNIMVYLNEDPEHVNRQISSIKTWKSRRLQLNGFKTFTDADIRRIIRYVNARERHFKYVELNDNGITDAQALSLAVGFKHVYKLYLDGNAITDPAAAAIIHFDQYLTLSFRDNKMILNKDNLIYDNALLTRRCTNIRLKGTGVSKALIVNICEHCESLRYRNVYSYTELSIREDHSIKLEEKKRLKKTRTSG